MQTIVGVARAGCIATFRLTGASKISYSRVSVGLVEARCPRERHCKCEPRRSVLWLGVVRDGMLGRLQGRTARVVSVVMSDGGQVVAKPMSLRAAVVRLRRGSSRFVNRSLVDVQAERGNGVGGRTHSMCGVRRLIGSVGVLVGPGAVLSARMRGRTDSDRRRSGSKTDDGQAKRTLKLAVLACRADPIGRWLRRRDGS